MEGYAENWTNETVSQFGKTNLMIKQDHLKYQNYGGNGPEVLFDLHQDPSESQNFIDDPDYTESVNWFRQRLSQLGHGPNPDPNYVSAGYTIYEWCQSVTGYTTVCQLINQFNFMEGSNCNDGTYVEDNLQSEKHRFPNNIT